MVCGGSGLLVDAHQITESVTWYEAKLRTAVQAKYRRIEGEDAKRAHRARVTGSVENCMIESRCVSASEAKKNDASDETRNNKEDNSSRCSTNEENSGPLAEIYVQLKRICTALRHDLEKDLKIQDAAVLPESVHLPRITAEIYAQVIPPLSLSALPSPNGEDGTGA